MNDSLLDYLIVFLGLGSVLFLAWVLLLLTRWGQDRKRVQTFLKQRAFRLSGWWACRLKRCDYYQVYQALGPPDLTHVGYHAAERLALEHRTNCSTRGERECEACRGWAERLRGEVWACIMGNKFEIGDRELEERTKGPYGFH